MIMVNISPNFGFIDAKRLEIVIEIEKRTRKGREREYERGRKERNSEFRCS